MNDSPRRLLLRVGAKVMALIAVTVAAYALFSSVREKTPEKAPSPATLRISLAEPATVSGIHRIQWSGGNLLLSYRTPDMLAALSGHRDALLDPQSRDARQPEGLSPVTRSRQPAIFLAYDRGTDMGCPLNWVPAGDRSAPLQPWPGGFRDTCRGSWYDAAGRVFKNQQAERNLDIPPYHLIGPDLLEVGVNGDNPASAN